MITLEDFKRLIRPIQNKIFLLIGRCILSAINNSGGTQKIDVVVLQNEARSNVERLQNYGFDSVPLPGSEGVILFINGNRNQAIALIAADRRYRPTDLIGGEVAMYTKDDKASQDDRIHLKSGKIHQHKNNQALIDSVVQAILTTPLFRVTGGTVELGAQVGMEKLANETFLSLFNTHIHSGVDAGPSNTGAPTVSAGASHRTTNVEAS